ncbi:MAG: nitroreductase family deazaflavin-dependent oxidoreductase [Chloroflexi bacterium]|nr:nitroreductase family deazaflavin-dependent oxidoreductase [Chloroflexota bacterium]
MVPPRWVFRSAWALHKAVSRLSGGRIGTRPPSERRVGTLFLLARGRQSGIVRRNGIFYLEDGPNLIVVASNAGAPKDPAWWSNLQALPDAEVELPGSRRAVRAREATASERARLWPRLLAANPSYADYQRGTARPIPVVVLEPR